MRSQRHRAGRYPGQESWERIGSGRRPHPRTDECTMATGTGGSVARFAPQGRSPHGTAGSVEAHDMRSNMVVSIVSGRGDAADRDGATMTDVTVAYESATSADATMRPSDAAARADEVGRAAIGPGGMIDGRRTGRRGGREADAYRGRWQARGVAWMPEPAGLAGHTGMVVPVANMATGIGMTAGTEAKTGRHRTLHGRDARTRSIE